jgi:hypothetical protein
MPFAVSAVVLVAISYQALSAALFGDHGSDEI